MTKRDAVSDEDVPPRDPPERVDPPSGSRELAHSDQADLLGQAGPDLLLAIARSQPFMRNFMRCADARYPRRANPETRVKQMIEDHPRWYKFCWWADWLLLLAVLLIALGVMLLSAYKAFYLPVR